VVVAAGLTAAIAAAASVPAAWADSTSAADPRAVAQAVLDWNANAVDAAVAACISPANHPLHESRLYAMTHAAIHDALNAINRHYRPYLSGLPRAPGASAPAAVASAARNVLVPVLRGLPTDFAGCIPGAVDGVETAYTAALAAIPNGNAKTKGVALGQTAASAIVGSRAGDGSDTAIVDPSYPEGTEPGQYRFTPGTPFVFAPGWGDVDPFVLKDAAQFRPGPPPELASGRYARDLDEVKRLGGDDVTTPSDRTADQTEIARFWLESSPSQWNRIASTVAVARKLGGWETARLFALLNLAMADGYIGTFDTKYHYNFWRPVTAIRLADTDGNDKTTVDLTWTPLEGNPPIPDYDSGHAVEGGAAAQVMKRVFGGDRATFSVCSLTLPAAQTCGQPSEVRRRYHSFSQAADENGLSRILVGFHFRTAVQTGIEHGRRIGDRAVDRFLQPLG
jgi:hypothetical protein